MTYCTRIKYLTKLEVQNALWLGSICVFFFASVYPCMPQYDWLYYSENLKNTLTVRTEYQADFIEWHPSGALLVVLNNKGELQVNILQLDINNI